MEQEARPSTILVVDDQEAMRYATSRVIRSGGYDVIEATTGLEALERAKLLPGLVVLDIHLPDLDGREVCRRLKADPVTASVPVLHLTSAYRKTEDRLSALEDGVDGYLTHPVEPRELLAQVKTLLRLTAAERESRRLTDEARRLLAEVEDSRRELLAALEDQRKAQAEVQRLNGELEQRVEERTRKLEEAIREMEAFSYSVSHDLRAPLRAIDGFSSLLTELDGEALSDEGKRLLGVIRANTRKMSNLISDLLEFSRVGRTELRVGRVDMASLARASFDENVPDEVERGRIAFECGPLAAARGDASLLRIVWSNLIGNAVKFSRGRQRPVVRISSEVHGPLATYRISDNGVGFDMAYSGKIFEVFQRLHGMTEFEGTGVGLALVHRIITRHGGDLQAVGAVEEGATITFTLPAA